MPVAVEWGREADGKGTGRGSGCDVTAQAGHVPYDVKNVYKNRGSAKCDFTDSETKVKKGEERCGFRRVNLFLRAGTKPGKADEP